MALATSDDAGDAKTIQYTLDTAGPLSQVLTASSGKDTVTFLYGLQRIAAVGRDTRYYGADVRGSVRTTTDEKGKLKSTSIYDAWGVPKDEADDDARLASLFGFTGERQDAKAGLVYLHTRWYDPAVGVFLSPDPAAGRPSDPRTLSPYAYAMDDPTSKVDHIGFSASSLLNGGQRYSDDGTAAYVNPTMNGSVPRADGDRHADWRWSEPFAGPVADIAAKLTAASIRPEWELNGFERAITSTSLLWRDSEFARAATARSVTTTLQWAPSNAGSLALKVFLDSRIGGAAVGSGVQGVSDYLFHPELTPKQRAERVLLVGAVGLAVAATAPLILGAAGVATTGVVTGGVLFGATAVAGWATEEFLFPRLGLGT
ncbi:MAG: RHS repeat-associated core domain-containing protein [Chloroflexota bacterium]|nr:RHS repeat-associated core domain-containing protein [Chloroflexota bacterium]